MTKVKYWNKNECLEFLRRFDAFEHKYLYTRKSCVGKGGNGYNEELWNSILNSQGHGNASHNLTYEEESEAALGIRQVYCDEKHYTNEYLEMLNLVRDRFIYDYTGIAGLCDFFSPAYFEYEWGMHLEIDYNKHDSRYYRDHYVHQIRNMFEIFNLLDDFGYYEKCRKAYRDPENLIGTFIFDAIDQELLTMNCTDKELYGKIIALNEEKAFDDYKSQSIYSILFNPNPIAGCTYGAAIKVLINDLSSSVQSAIYQQITEKHSAKLRDMMFHYIIYTAAIIASLVHDVGYPISYMRRICGRINRYLPVNRLLASANRDYSEIEKALQGSLLFKTVSPAQIEKRLNDDDEHGVQSAIVLLMYFHLYGKRLSALQRCAIELAALVIYNHTNKYDVINKKDAELIRSDIYKEPLSHLFRLCDDLQEWDRVYFEITDKSNVFICSDCQTPVLRKYGTDICKPEHKEYTCCCEGSSGRYHDTSEFVNRRIINVIGCDKISVEQGEKHTSHITKFTMNFDCGALLNALTFSSSFGKVRAKGIFELKRLCSYQGASDTILIDSFVSSNPFVVKIRILEEYAKSVLGWQPSLGDNFDEFLFEHLDEIFKFKNSTSELVKSLWKKNLVFYCWLAEKGKKFAQECGTKIDALPDSKVLKEFKELGASGVNTANKKVLKAYDKVYEELLKEFKNMADKSLKSELNFEAIIAGNQDIYALCCDYLLQQVHMLGYERVKAELENQKENLDLNKILRNTIYRMFYEKLYYTDDAFSYYVDEYISRADYDDVKQLCRSYKGNAQPYDEYVNANYKHIDFFVDYGLFVKLWNVVKERSKFYFDVYGVDETGTRCPFDTPDKNVVRNYLLPANPVSDASVVLECTNQGFDLDNNHAFKYEFNILKQEDNCVKKAGKLTVTIDQKKAKSECIDTDVNKTDITPLLKDLADHHNVKLEW